MLVSGCWTLDIFDHQGKVLSSCTRKNAVVSLAATQDADLLRGVLLSSPIRAMALGSDGTATSSGLTQLFAEVTRKAIPVAGVNQTYQKNLRSGVTVTLQQTFGPGLTFTLREAALFADIVELSTPTVAPILTPSESGGLLTAGTYTVVYTWKNNNGETQASPSAQTAISGSTGKITVTVPALPAQATQTRVFVGIGTPVINGTTTTTSYEATDPSAGPDEPPASNTSLIPGILNSGAMLNRVVFPDQSITSGTTFAITVPLLFNSGA